MNCAPPVPNVVSRALYVRAGLCALVAAFLFFGCRKDSPIYEERPLNGNNPRVFGHGGMGIGYHYPMDSFESLRAGLRSGATGVEMDLRLSADSILFLFHDVHLSSSTNCDGAIERHTAAELNGCRYRRTFFSKPADVCSADRFFSAIDSKAYRFTMECKIAFDDQSEFVFRFARALNAMVNRYDIADRCFVESYNPWFLAELHRLNSRLGLFMYTSSLDTTGVFLGTPIRGITMDLNKVGADDIAAAHRNGLEVSVFNARTPHDNVRALTIGADNIQTDKVKHLVDILK